MLMFSVHWGIALIFIASLFTRCAAGKLRLSEPSISMPEKISLKMILGHHSLSRPGSATQPLSDKCIRNFQFHEFSVNKISKILISRRWQCSVIWNYTCTIWASDELVHFLRNNFQNFRVCLCYLFVSLAILLTVGFSLKNHRAGSSTNSDCLIRKFKV